MTLDVIGRVAGSLGADLDIRVRWRGEALDRLLDAAHAALVDRIVGILRAHEWETGVEVTFSIGGERGAIDVLARHARTGMLLVVEVKSVIPDAQSMLAGLDRKARLATVVARQRGWMAGDVSRLLVVGEGSTARRRTQALGSMFATAYPVRGHTVRAWLREPSGRIAGLLFLPYDRGATRISTAATRQRVRRHRTHATPA